MSIYKGQCAECHKEWTVKLNVEDGPGLVPPPNLRCCCGCAVPATLVTLTYVGEDKEIERLKAAYDESMAISFAYHKRIAALETLLEKVPHDKITANHVSCRHECPRCAYEKLPKTK